MNIKVTEQQILEIINLNSGMNIYQLSKIANEKYNVGYSTVHRIINLLEANGLIRIETKILKEVKIVYAKG